MERTTAEVSLLFCVERYQRFKEDQSVRLKLRTLLFLILILLPLAIKIDLFVLHENGSSFNPKHFRRCWTVKYATFEME